MHRPLALMLMSLACALPLRAQTTPIPRSDFDDAQAQYRAYALGEFQSVVQQWVEAANADDLERVARLYTPDALLDFQSPARGREAIRSTLGSWLSGVEQVQVGLSDFDASGNMAYGSTHIQVRPTSGSELSGTVLFVMRRQGRDWRIRAQSVILH